LFDVRDLDRLVEQSKEVHPLKEKATKFAPVVVRRRA
jgi:hypothetical protein